MLCVGIWKPGGGLFDSFFGIDTSLGDAWVLNPVDFASGNPFTSPGTVIVRPVVTNQNGLHVEFSLTCQGCASLTGTTVPPIDKSDPQTNSWASPTPQSIYNYNPQTASAVQSIPLYQKTGVYVACSNCYLALLQAGLYLAVDYNTEDSIGFQTIQIEADAEVLANLDLTLASDGTQDSSYVNPLVTHRVLFKLPFLVAGIAFSATIEADLSAVFSVKGTGRMSITAGKCPNTRIQADPFSSVTTTLDFKNCQLALKYNIYINNISLHSNIIYISKRACIQCTLAKFYVISHLRLR